jgi:hypothetical protein
MRTIQHWIAGSETTGARPGPARVYADHHRTHMHFPAAT